MNLQYPYEKVILSAVKEIHVLNAKRKPYTKGGNLIPELHLSFKIDLMYLLLCR